MEIKVELGSKKIIEGGHVFCGVQTRYVPEWYDHKKGQLDHRMGDVQKATALSRQLNFFWNNKIASSGVICFRARRLYQRLRRKQDNDDQEEIHKSKRNCFKQLCEDADIKPWNETYKVVMKKRRRSFQVTCSRLFKKKC